MELPIKPSPQGIVKSFSSDELGACVKDVIARQGKGFLPDGALRTLAARLDLELDIDDMSSFSQAEAAVLREASLRFLSAPTSTRAKNR